LEWTTSTEVNNDYFTLEKSTDAQSFVETGIVDGAGNSYSNISYQFIDDGVTEQLNYYRLKQTDFDGQYSYSNIVALSGMNSDSFYFSNSNNILYINGGNKSSKNLMIYSIQGQLLKEYHLNEDQEAQSVNLNLSNGFYIVSLQIDGKVISKKIVITR